jgi:hypothetical protein
MKETTQRRANRRHDPGVPSKCQELDADRNGMEKEVEWEKPEKED